MVPSAPQVAEFQVDQLDFIFVYESGCLVEELKHVYFCLLLHQIIDSPQHCRVVLRGMVMFLSRDGFETAADTGEV